MSEWRDREAAIVGWSRVFRDVTMNYILKHVPAGARVLDCGAGDGSVSFALAERGCVVDALDARPERVEIMGFEKNELAVNPILGDFFDTDLPLEGYDCVISRQFVPAFEERWPLVLRRKLELCRRGGCIIFQHHCAESGNLGKQIAKGSKYRAAVERGYRARGVTSEEELRAFCKSANTSLVDYTPISFLGPRGILYRAGMTKDERQTFSTELDEWLQCDEVRAFAQWFEESVVSKMPVGLAASYMAVLNKA